MKKEKYVQPTLKMILLESEDIIMNSNVPVEDDVNDEGLWTPYL